MLKLLHKFKCKILFQSYQIEGVAELDTGPAGKFRFDQARKFLSALTTI